MINTSTEKKRYSKDELAEFEKLLHVKLATAYKELRFILEGLTKRADSEGNVLPNRSDLIEDGTIAVEREKLTQLAARQRKFIKELEAAHVRIKNATYGVCVDTGKLISKERLRAVPHTTQSIEAKQTQDF